MSISDRIRSIIENAAREHQKLRQAQDKRVAAEATELSRESREGSAWLAVHVMPVLLELRRALTAQAITVEMEENLAPEAHLPARQFTGPSVALRLVQKGATAPAASARYVFHCDGEFLSVTRSAGTEARPLGMPFEIDRNPGEAEEIVLEIVRRALADYYQRLPV
jgi:hypothetical protein